MPEEMHHLIIGRYKKAKSNDTGGSSLCVFFSLVFCLLLLQGCGVKGNEASGTGVYFDTVVDIRVCGDDADTFFLQDGFVIGCNRCVTETDADAALLD